MILDIIKHSFEYIFTDKKSFLKVSILSLLSFLIIPFILLEGYSYRITSIGVNSLINANDPFPEFKNPVKMFVEGLKIILVNFIYSIPFLIVLGIIATTMLSNLIIINPGNNIELGLDPLLLIIIFLVGFFTFLFSKVAISHMVYEKSFSKAFKIKEITKIIKNIGISNYFLFFVGYLVLVVAINLIVFIATETIMNAANLVHIGINFGTAHIGLDIVVFILISALILYPVFTIFESRGIANMYNLR